MKKIIFAILLMVHSINIHAIDFNKYFTDKTLRIDYIFAGNQKHQDIFLDEMKCLPKWYGRKVNLDSIALAGNGNITVRSHREGKIIYRQSFSTLFQEWLTYDEAATTSRSFENVFLVPYPKDTIDVTVTLFDNRQEKTCDFTHTVIPSDILIHKMATNGTTPYETIIPAKDPEHCIRIAYLAEGFKEDEMGHFIEKVHEANDALFAHEPFKSLQDKFEIIAVKAVSKESGTSTPSKNDWRNTALSSHFDTFYSNRYLTTLNIKDMHDLLAGTPYEHIIVLVNTGHYGGGGIFNSYNLSMTDDARFRPVVVHEFGHSFAGLADEYAYEDEALPFYPTDVEPWEPNITTLIDFGSKWADMINSTPKETRTKNKKNTNAQNIISTYEGAGYSLKGVYRPCPDCRMRTNDTPEFCPVCTRAISRIIEFYTK